MSHAAPYMPRYFAAFELVPARVYEILGGEPRRVFGLFDDRILRAADMIRMRWGKMVCNTWFWDGAAQYRGWRSNSCPVGTEWSQHKFGRALDLIPVEFPLNKIRQALIEQPVLAGYFVTGIELGVDWLHIDCGNRDRNGRIVTFNG